MNKFLIIIGILISACAPEQSTIAEKQTFVPLNIVLIVADDLGVNDLGYLGGEMKTPQLDRLASKAKRFERFYSWALCSPARSALITGEDPMSMDMAWNPLRPEDTRGLPLNVPTIAERLKKANYQTACIGKWHLGHAKKSMHPNARGFDHIYGNLHGAIDYETHVARNQELDWYRNQTPLKEEGYATQLLGTEAASWITKSQQQQAPFFLYLSFTAPHLPLQAPIESIRRYHMVDDPARRVFCAMVDEMDLAVGKVIEALEGIGQSDNTLIIFLADNGAGKEDGGSNGQLRGGKGSSFEGGIRVPAFLYWPNKTTGELVQQARYIGDVAPTILAAAGLSLEELSGNSLMTDNPPQRQFYFAARNNNWSNYAVVDGFHKFVLRERNDGQLTRERLFNLSEDPFEENDLSESYPDKVQAYRDGIRNWSR